MEMRSHSEEDATLKAQTDPLELIHKHFLDLYSKSDLPLKKSLESKRQMSTNKLPVMKFEEKKMISAKIQSNSAVSGFPTCISNSKHMILIGSSLGLINVFASEGSELKVLKQKSVGSVVSLDISSDEQWAAAGYHGGQVALWDLRSGNCVRNTGNLFSQPVISCKFWKNGRNSIIAADLTGKVVMIEYGKNFLTTTVTSNCVLTGEAGQIASLEALYPDPSWPHPTDSCVVVAIACVDRILIYELEPEVTILMGIERPDEVGEGFLPSISLKIAAAPGEDSPIDPILAISWGVKVYLYKVKFASPEGIQLAGSYSMDAEIKSIHLLSHDIICVVSNTREVIILTTRGFSKPGEEPKNAVLEESFVNREVAAQAYVKDSNGKEKYTYHNTIQCLDSSIFILGNKQLHKGRVITWKECMLDLSKNGDWIAALCAGLDFYQGKGRKAYSLPLDKKEFKETFEEVIDLYVKSPNISWDFKISNTVEFCVGVESVDFLFKYFFDYFIDEGDGKENLKMFIEIIEPFVINGEIKVIPSAILGNIFSFYLNNKKVSMIEKLILHIQHTCFDYEFLYPVCEDNGLALAHVYLSFGNLKVEKTIDFLHQCVKKNEETRHFFAYQLLWFLRLCLKGQKFPKFLIKTDDWNKVVISVFTKCLESDLLETLISIDADVTLKVIWVSFQDLSPSQALINSKTVKMIDIINKLESACQGESFHYFSIFIARLSIYYSELISKSLAIKVLVHLMRPYNYLENIKSVEPCTIQNYIFLNQRPNKTMTEFDYSIEEKSKLLLSLSKNYKDYSSSELEDLYKIAVNSAYTEVLVFLLELKKDYTQCFLAFLQCSNPEARLKVFDWLTDSLNKLEGESLESLKSQVKESLNFLVDIDSDKTAKIVKDWFKDEQLDIVHKLDGAPKLQMKYLGELLKNPGKEKIEEKLIVLYVKLLCENSPEQVLSFLKSREDDSLGDCLAICLDFHIIEASAYLYERLGDIKNALELHLNMIESKKKQIQTGLKNYEKLLYSEILQEINRSVSLCVRNSQRLDEIEIENHWFCLLSRTLETYIDLAPHFQLHLDLEQCIQSGIKQTIEHMIGSVDFLKVINFIVARFGSIPFKYFKENFIGVLSRFSYQKNIIKKAIDLLCTDIKHMTQQLLLLKSKGISSKRFYCSTCTQAIVSDDLVKNREEKFVLFICGHVYHSRCIKKKICDICVKAEQRRGNFSIGLDR